MFAPVLDRSAPLSSSLSAMTDAASSMRSSATEVSVRERAEAITAMLRASDALIASALALLGRGGLEAATGLPAEMVLALEGRRMGSEARFLTHAAGVLREMPHLAAAFASGSVSWGQVRAIVCSVGRVRVADRTAIDQGIAERAPRMSEADPEALVDWVDDEVLRRRAEMAVAAEDAAIKTSFLSIQPRLDGGASIYGEADAASAATICDALDAVAEDPVRPDEGPSRAEQRFDALLRMCEATLSGRSGGEGLRPRPRLLATFDLTRDNAEPTVLLTALTGRAPRLTPVARDTLACDATVVPVVFDGARPVAVGDASTTFSDKVRTAIAARDRRCRFCGRAPAPWCDVHHTVRGTGSTVDDGVLLCRPCHRRVHRFRWVIRMLADGAVEFSRGRVRFLSMPP